MFPALKNRMKQAGLARLDLLLEFATLGEAGIDEHGRVIALEPASAPTFTGRNRDDCPWRGVSAPRRCERAARS